ncbi:MAG TPA: cupin domain-containing protein [Candidatus Udaeobacter sp.]|nr:cupin domain-containing protein [Candidatus Udaeobacter sp.]
MEITRNIQPEFVDARGAITKLLDDGKTVIKSILMMTCNKDAIRANHFHKEDGHYVYMLTGKMEYTEAPLIDGNPDLSKKETVEISAGDMVFSPPMVAHAMNFLEDTVCFVFALKSRSQDDYEQDTVRVKLV